MDKVAEDLERVRLFDFFFLKELGDLSHSLTNILKLSRLLLLLLLELLNSLLGLLELSFEVLCHFH